MTRKQLLFINVYVDLVATKLVLPIFRVDGNKTICEGNNKMVIIEGKQNYTVTCEKSM